MATKHFRRKRNTRRRKRGGGQSPRTYKENFANFKRIFDAWESENPDPWPGERPPQYDPEMYYPNWASYMVGYKPVRADNPMPETKADMLAASAAYNKAALKSSRTGPMAPSFWG